MRARLAMAAFIVGAAAVQTLADLPAAPGRVVLLATAALWLLIVHWRPPARALAGVTCCIGAACVGAGYAIERGQARLDDALSASLENQVSRITLRVASLAQYAPDAIRFDADVMDADRAGVPTRIHVSWPIPMERGGGIPAAVIPGQRWRMAVVLKRPHALQNPHAADGEARMFRNNIRATGAVRGRPKLLDDEGWRPGFIAVHRVRHMLRKGMERALGQARYGAVVIALALGDQAAVARDDWRVFNATGITHLVSISGLHVTLVAGFAGTVVSWLWRRLRWRGSGLAELWPAQLAGILAALGVAFCYCLLAGWGIPARRTFFTLAVAGTAALARVRLSTSGTLLLTATVVIAFDPWATMAPGFWLSFGAVAAVLAWSRAAQLRPQADDGFWRAAWRRLSHAGRLQCVVTLSLTPLLAFLTQQVSLASPIANAVAIPLVSFVVTPLALLCAALCAIPYAHDWAAFAGGVAHDAFGWAMRWAAWLAERNWAVWDVAAAPSVLLALAFGGLGWALQPPGMASRRWAWLLLLPALCWRPARPDEGAWRMTVLDVGQGGGVVVETATRTLVFDAGPMHRNGSDGAQRVVWPYLRARGVRRIDTLVVSHGDQDHAGGLDSLLRAIPVDVAYAPFDVESRLRRDANMRGQERPPPSPGVSRRCEAGQSWDVDGVGFRFLHPPAVAPTWQDDGGAKTGSTLGAPAPRRQAARHSGVTRGGKGQSNAGGCVLLVMGRYHAALLPGDVGIAEERTFAGALPSPVDVVIAPHHGSATSSSEVLVRAAAARHVVAQVGYANRFKHPASSVQRRWRRAGTTFWRTDQHGAVIAQSAAAGLAVGVQRERARRYWHAPPAP
ncbi:DNA internalization-related competence protein ComEC/Rec2 [Bordetella flabilis]|uniref:DNA internalization-related competence protein ComEC/Rec2 n=1 Tax=Bordetella flabilis TaxID=463014 RepID=A0A193GBP6_9BORD|nr:DNA internalization-related competence protein ComEC/Rec2 [Bordetella flabilis]ANN77432.1 DNA internalization-related competence protein ComEC/Rec2 [Bordetella flabilis]